MATKITHICSVDIEMSDGHDAIGRVPYGLSGRERRLVGGRERFPCKSDKHNRLFTEDFVSTDCGRAAAFFSFETDKSRPPFLEALRDK